MSKKFGIFITVVMHLKNNHLNAFGQNMELRGRYYLFNAQSISVLRIYTMVFL